MIPYVNIHTHNADIEHLTILNGSIGRKDGKQYYSFGIHPWDIDKTDREVQLRILGDLGKEKKILALGEVGIDRAIQIPIDIQIEIFKQQIDIANQYNLPVIIHCVRAWADILAEKKHRKNTTPWILHGFTGNLQTANQLIKAGIYLSFGVKLVQSQKLKETFKRIPKEFVFLETDDSDAKIEEIYQKAAEIYDICIDELKAKIFQNFIKVFGVKWEQNG